MLELIVDREGKRFSKNLSVQSTYKEISWLLAEQVEKKKKMQNVDIKKEPEDFRDREVRQEPNNLWSNFSLENKQRY